MVRIGTWNLENLFRPEDEAGPGDPVAYEAKLTALAEAIVRMAPDVLAVQEVGNPDALADLAERAGGGWHCVTAGVEPGQRPIRVGYLSRLPLTDVAEVTRFPPELRPIQVDDDGTRLAVMGRPALRARVEVGGQPIDLITCHLKSKLLSFPPGPDGRPRFDTGDEGERARVAVYALSRRAAEAATVRAAATDLHDGQGQHRRPIVCGTSRTCLRRRPPRSCPARPARRSAPTGSTSPTGATASGCGTWPPASPNSNGSAAATGAAAS